MSMEAWTLTHAIYNPERLPVSDPIDDRARSILSRYEIGASTAAGRLFRHCFTELEGRGGTIRIEDRVRVMVECEINTESNLRKAVERLGKSGLAERTDSPERGKKTALVLRILSVPVPHPQQVLPGFDSAAPDLKLASDASAHSECAPPVRTESAHPTQSEATCELQAFTPILDQTVTQTDAAGQNGIGDIEGQVDEDECTHHAKLEEKALRFFDKLGHIEKWLGFDNNRMVPQQYKYLAPAWAWLNVVCVLSDAEIEDTVQYGKDLVREKNHREPSKPCAKKILNVLKGKPRELLARHGLLNDRGRVQMPRFPMLKRDLKEWGVQWQARWDQKPPPETLPRRT
jgi:hypothetical protein